MSAVIKLPAVPEGMTLANIYSNDGATDTLVDTIPATILEWESATEPVTSIIKVEFTDGVTPDPKITVQTFEQKLIYHMRNVENISDTVLPDERIVALLPTAKAELKTDICMYADSQPVASIRDEYYQLPNRFYYDENFGGVVSSLDFELYTTDWPILTYSERTPIVPVMIDIPAKTIKLESELPTTKKMFVNFFYTGRRLDSDEYGIILLGAKIASLYAAELYTSASSGSSSTTSDSVKIGDITIKNSAGTSTITQLKDGWIQKTARYKKLVANFKIGFYKVK